METERYDAVVVGSGPNGLAAAIVLAQARLSVLLVEGKDTIGGGMRSAELTLPGFLHDICSAIHPLGMASPLFSKLPLSDFGLKWIQPGVPLAHLFSKDAVIMDRSIEETCKQLKEDAGAYMALIKPLAEDWNDLAEDILAPLHFPVHFKAFSRFAYHSIQSAEGLASRKFMGRNARGLFAGLAAHSMLPLNKLCSAAYGLVLSLLGHTVGWPMPQGGTQKFADALAAYFVSIGGKITAKTYIQDIDQIPKSRVILFDVSPRQLLRILGDRLPWLYRERLHRYRYGMGVFKMDWALSEPIPWKFKDCFRAGTIHIGGTMEEIARGEWDAWEGRHSQSFILLAQPTLFDPSRAPPGKHIAWGYCHVPNGSTADMSSYIENKIEEAAPGFKECILAKATKNAMEMQEYNPNYVGGDINGGAGDITQLFTRPVASIHPYATPLKGVYICSASTPPGGGVHGMCGYHAAQAVLKRHF